MGVIRRLGGIVSANVNDLVERIENPERMLRHAVREMEQAVGRALDGVARSIAGERQLARERDGLRADEERWRARGRAALGIADEELARGAVARALELARAAAALEPELESTRASTASMRRQLRAMQDRLAEARRKLATLCARQRLAEASRRFGRELEAWSPDAEAFARFERLERRVDQAEAEAVARRELCGGIPFEFGDEREARDAEVEREIQRLRAEPAPADGT